MGEETVSESSHGAPAAPQQCPGGVIDPKDAERGQMPGVRLLVVVKDPEARGAYEEALGKVGVAYDVAHCFNDVVDLSVENAYSGLLIDILTLIRSSKEEKQIAYDCLNYYPSLRVKWDARQKAMNLSPLEQSLPADTATTLNYFIESRCKPFTARTLRKFERKETYLNGILLASGSEDGGVKTFTVNISQGGAFIHTTGRFVKGEVVRLRFLDLGDDDPVRGSVCWQIPWGVCRNIPGIGIRFDFSTAEQKEQVRKMANL